MNTSRFAVCALAGAVTLALQAQAFAEESTILVTGSEQGSVLLHGQTAQPNRPLPKVKRRR